MSSILNYTPLRTCTNAPIPDTLVKTISVGEGQPNIPGLLWLLDAVWLLLFAAS